MAADGDPTKSVYGGVPASRIARIHKSEEAEAIDMFNDWGSSKHVPPESSGRRAVSSPPALVDDIRKGLASFDEHIVNIHCCEDGGYPWVQVAFNKIVSPDVALGVGDALVTVAGADRVYFNSLRPNAIYFLPEPAFDDPRPDLPASRYGVRLADIKKSWGRTDKGAGSRALVGRRSGSLPRTIGG
jgi:hypothetical protein